LGVGGRGKGEGEEGNGGAGAAGQVLSRGWVAGRDARRAREGGCLGPRCCCCSQH
jgi:hypothetical protein